MTGIGPQIAFGSLAALTLVSAFFVVQSRNIVHAAFWLLPCFVGIAALFATLEAHFLFVAQLLIYAGAILVLILFALMLTRDVMNPHVSQTNRAGIPAGAACAIAALAIGYALSRGGWNVTTVAAPGALEQTRALGSGLIGLYAVPFEVSSLILLAALIGSVVMARSATDPEGKMPALADLDGHGEAVVEIEAEPVQEVIGAGR